MLNIFSPLKTLVKLKKKTDNGVFVLHTKLTVTALFACSLILTAKQLIGEPILCIGSGSNGKSTIAEKVLNNFCLVNGTFTISSKLNNRVGVDAVARGVSHWSQDESEERVFYHRYYQWVWLVFFLQGVAFYMPQFLWKNWQGKLVESVVKKLSEIEWNETKDEELTDAERVKAEELENRKAHLAKIFLVKQPYCSYQTEYFVKFVICEFLCLINVVAQFCLMEKLLDGKFMKYGYEVMCYWIGFQNIDIEELMDEVFPKLTKCAFNTYGGGGSVQNFDILCVLPLNIFNEKAFAVIWLWFCILIAITSAQIVMRVMILYSKTWHMIILRKEAPFVETQHLRNIIARIDYSGVFMLVHVARCADPVKFCHFLTFLQTKSLKHL